MSAQTERDAVQTALQSRAWERICEEQPGNAGAVAAWSNFLREQARHDDAIALLDKALRQYPEHLDLLLNLGVCFQETRQTARAQQTYERILAVDPTHAIALYNLGCMANERGALTESQTLLKRSVSAKPDYLDAVSMLLRVSQQMCDWAVTEDLEKRCIAAVEAGQTVFPFAFLSLPATQAQQAACAHLWFERRYGKRAVLAHAGKTQATPDARIRVGFLSSDYHDHPTARLLVGVLEHWNRQRFELHAFSGGPDDGSPLQHRTRAAFDRFHSVRGLTDLQAAQCVAQAGIDILIDLGGYTANSRTGVLAYKPAPIQAQYLGYPGSLQMPTVDYILTDSLVTPAHLLEHYAEKPAWLPHCYQCNDDRREMSTTPITRASEGLPEQAIVLASLNQSYKIRRDLFASWCNILKHNARAVLWLLRFNDEAVAHLRTAAVRNGVDADRIVFAKPATAGHHQARLALADIFLDTWVYNSHTTASDALWVGKPLVTLQGETFPSRVAASILKAAHLDALITHSVTEYEACVVRLMDDPGFARLIHHALAERRLQWPLFDTARFTRALENLLLQMQARYTAGLPAAALWAEDTQMAHAPTHPIPEQRIPPMSTATLNALPLPTSSETGEHSTPAPRRELLIGCGSNHSKRLCLNNRAEWDNLTTLDYNGDHKPDVVHDLMQLPLPFADNTFDEIHAYEVLEHTGAQGDYRFFFAQFTDFWRVLKPGGVLMATCPSRHSPWAWGDPSHTRVIQPENLIFLDQGEYIRQVGKTAMSDFRNLYSADFQPVFAQDDGTTFSFAIKAVKPSRHRRPNT